MFVFIISLIIVVAFLLVLVVLAQNSKGGGVSSQFGGSSTSQIMGVKKTGDLLERITWGFAIAIMALTLSTNFMVDNVTTTQEGNLSPNVEEAQQQGQGLPDLAPLQDNTNTEGTTSDDTEGSPEEEEN